MKTPTVENLIAELTDLKVEERDLDKRLGANRGRQAEIIGSLQVKPESQSTPRRPAKRAAQVLAPLRPSRRRERAQRSLAAVPPVAPPPPASKPAAQQASTAVSESARVRDYLIALDDDATITTESVTKALGIKSSIVSTALSRVTGKLIERVPGTQRGKFRKINRAA